FHDLIELGGDLAAVHPHDRPLQKNILAAREVGVKARRELDQRSDAPAYAATATRGSHDAREQLEDGGLPRSIGSDDPQRFTRLHLERHIAEGPELTRLDIVRARRAAHDETSAEHGQKVPQAVVHLAVAKLLPDAPERDGGVTHS